MSEFRFAEPGWAMLLWAVLALTAGLIWLDARSGSTMARFLSPLMQGRLAQAASASRRRTAIALLGLSLAMGVVALMRPQWGVHLIATPRVGAEIMVCLDVSNSMLAEDVAPNRLERAKAEIRDLLTYLRGDSVGLIAFAGRATVLAPITPDFSFLRLVLDEAGPRSVSRGGTRLEEPIRKAVAGFAAGASVSRSIILITDGEDHDSFPLEAAKEAAARGIKILAIGFGDEKGSPVQVTDPKTGAKHSLRDSSGHEVMTRLDGETLRQIALATGGAYVPAGTGALDLQSIYETHIAGLTRGSLDGETRTIRGEAYQVAVLASLILLVASVVVAAGRGTRRKKASAVLATALLLSCLAKSGSGPDFQGNLDLTPISQLLLPAAKKGTGTISQGKLYLSPFSWLAPASAYADEGVISEEAAPQADDAAATADAPAVAPTPAPEEKPKPPREVYNAGLDKLAAGELDGAEKLFEDARTRAEFDGLLRRDATYDLGVLDARRADAKIEATPEEALAALERSASWFRETVSLDAKDADARHNLELVLRRALVLADAIAKKKQKELLDDITALMEEQRGFLTTLRTAVQGGTIQGSAIQGSTVQGGTAQGGPPPVDSPPPPPPPPPAAPAVPAPTPASANPEHDRQAFRELATQQLALSSKAEDVSERAVREQVLIRAKPADQQAPEEQMKAVQLDGVLESLHQAREQMGQSRGRLRRLEGPGAYRAASTTLTNLKRARDRLLDPVKVLDVLIADAVELSRLTGAKIALDSGNTEIPPQKWLTAEHLTDTASEVRERVEELDYNFVTVLTQSDAAAAGGQTPDEKNAALLERVREAEPLIAEGAAQLAAAKDRLAQNHVRESLEPQYAAITKLAAARESFLDLQRLIELLHEDEKRIDSIVSPKEEKPAAEKAEYAAMAAAAQKTNTARGAHVERSLKEDIAAAEQAVAAKQAEEAAAQQQAQQQAQQGGAQGAQPTPAAPTQQGPDPEAEKQRLELAGTYLAAARGALDEASTKLDDLAGQAETHGAALPAEAWQPSQAAVTEAVTRIEDLRRLFFSVIDHLKELAQRQLELGDQTEETAAMASASPDRDFTDKAGPLGARQETLSTTAAPIAEALREQSKQPVPPEAAGQPSQAPADLPQRLADAATHVDTARTSMESATQGLAINPPAFADTRASQNTALQELAAAIQLLTPPDQQKDKQQQDQQKQDQDKQDQQKQQDEQQQQQQQQQGGQPQAAKKEKDEEKTDPAQLLQGIRDREAERRENKDKAAKQGYDPVEKDW